MNKTPQQTATEAIESLNNLGKGFGWGTDGRERDYKFRLPHWKEGEYVIAKSIGVLSFVGMNQKGEHRIFEKHPYAWELVSKPDKSYEELLKDQLDK